MGKKYWSRLVVFFSIVTLITQTIPAVGASVYPENPSSNDDYAINELAGKVVYGALKVIDIENNKIRYIPFETSSLKKISAGDESEVAYGFNILPTFNWKAFDKFIRGPEIREWRVYQNCFNEASNNKLLSGVVLATLFTIVFFMILHALGASDAAGPGTGDAVNHIWMLALVQTWATLPPSRLILKLRKRPASSRHHEPGNIFHASLSGLLNLPMEMQANINVTSVADIRLIKPEALNAKHRQTVSLLPANGTIETSIYHLTKIILISPEGKKGPLYRSSDFIQRDEL